MMKKFFSSKTLTTGVLALFLTIASMTAATAQTGSGGSTTGSNTSGGYTDTRGQRDDDFDWGWLGLLGLTGLLGLLPKKRRVDTEYRTSNTATGATSR